MPINNFPIFVRSYYSFLAGCRSPADLLKTAVKAGYRTVCLVDRDGFYGAPEFFKEARRLGVKPLLGVSFPSESVTLLCLNQGGFVRANEVITKRNFAGNSAGPHRQADIRGLSAGRREESPYSGSVVPDLLENGWKGNVVVTSSGKVQSVLAERSRNRLYAAYHVGGTTDLATLDGGGQVQPFAVTDVAWLDSEDVEVCRILQAICARSRGDIQKLETDAAEMPHRRRQLADLIDISAMSSAPPAALCAAAAGAAKSAPLSASCPAGAAALSAAAGFAEAADLDGLFTGTPVFPRFEALAPQEEAALLKKRCEKGLRRRYRAVLPAVRARMEWEFGIIRRNGYAGYFLVVDDIVRRGSLSCGRGSAAASIVCYLLGITQVDPIKQGLHFQRFLSDSRTEPPDIDVDFPWDERKRIREYVFRRYPGKAALVADHVTFGPRSSLRESAKAAGYGEKECRRFVDLGLEGDHQKVPKNVRVLSSRLRGIPRYIGTHTGGIVITPVGIEQFSHTQPAAGGFPAIAWDKKGTREAGLVKIDVMGSRSLAVLRDTKASVAQIHGHKPDLQNRRIQHDPQTREMIAAGDTVGVFYIESPATRAVLKRMRSPNLAHLIVATSIIRPAAKEYLTEYLERLSGKSWQPLHPALSAILQNTLGVMVFQEDICRVLENLCGFDPAEADAFRRDLSRTDRDLLLPGWRRRFFLLGCRNGVGETVLSEVWDMICSFRGYSFCKSHSASYASLAYKLAYLKAHFPLELLTAVINNGGGYYERQVYLSAVRRAGFAVRMPDVNKSRVEYTVEDAALRIGLSQLRRLPVAFSRRLVADREVNGPFVTLEDFRRRMRPAGRIEELLGRGGCLGSLDLQRKHSLSAPDFARIGVPHAGATTGNLQTTLFRTESSFPAECSWAKMVAEELSSLGLFASCHPVTPFRARRRGTDEEGPPLVDSRTLIRHTGETIRILCYLCGGKEVETRRKEHMGFLCFEDEYGMFQATVYPRTYRRLLPALRRGRVFRVSGRIELEHGAVGSPSLVLQELSPP